MPFFSIVYISLFTMFVYLYAGLSLSASTSFISIVYISLDQPCLSICISVYICLHYILALYV